MPVDHSSPLSLLPETFDVAVHHLNLTAATPFRVLLGSIRQGKKVVAADTYATAMAFYSWLRKFAQVKIPVTDYASSQRNKAFFASLTDGFLLRITHGRAMLRSAPQNPWLAELFPEKDDFLLKFSDFLGINGSWQWFRNGILFPGLDYPLHPYYGVYFPTRFGHLQLFDQWLKSQKPFSQALDMGAGCGVLSFYLLKNGCQKVTATDINPFAIKSIRMELKNHPEASKIGLHAGSFFDGLQPKKFDLVVFNPPWTPGSIANSLDLATHYGQGFFDQFFEQASRLLSGHTLLVIPFSNFGLVAGITKNHPIANEIENNRFEVVEHRQQAIQQAPSKRRNWLAELRQNEMDELWVLQKSKSNIE
ncbi:MAG: methyltransferase [Bacteroidales bacterium]|nr:methyltransferase [Bacteroidales bacterium]